MSDVSSPEQWINNPAHELHGIYADTITKRFGIFGVLPFLEAQASLMTTYEGHIPGKPVEQHLWDVIVSPGSFDRYESALGSYFKDTGLDDWLEHWGSVAIVTDHGQFTDVPVTAEAIGRLGLAGREKVLQVISQMISIMTLDLGGGGFVVTEKLRQISGLVKTVPRLDGSPSRALKDFRRESNASASDVLGEALGSRGVIAVESFIGRHNQASEDGKTLYIHEPNIRTAELLIGRHIQVVPVYIDCPTFKDDGSISTPDMTFEIFEPIGIDYDNAKAASEEIVDNFRKATERTVGHKYEHGVKVKSWEQQLLERGKQKVVNAFTGGPTETTTNY